MLLTLCMRLVKLKIWVFQAFFLLNPKGLHLALLPSQAGDSQLFYSGKTTKFPIVFYICILTCTCEPYINLNYRATYDLTPWSLPPRCRLTPGVSSLTQTPTPYLNKLASEGRRGPLSWQEVQLLCLPEVMSTSSVLKSYVGCCLLCKLPLINFKCS